MFFDTQNQDSQLGMRTYKYKTKRKAKNKLRTEKKCHLLASYQPVSYASILPLYLKSIAVLADHKRVKKVPSVVLFCNADNLLHFLSLIKHLLKTNKFLLVKHCFLISLLIIDYAIRVLVG